MKQKRQRQLSLSRDHGRSKPKEELTKWEQQTITWKKWIYSNNKLFTENKKEVVPNSGLFHVLSHAHSQIPHRGRKFTEHWLQENYAEISQKVVNTYMKMSPYHTEKKSLMNRVKSVQWPMQAPTFLSSLPYVGYECYRSSHKACSLYPLTTKSGGNLLDVLQQHCDTYGFPQKIVCHNGKGQNLERI